MGVPLAPIPTDDLYADVHMLLLTAIASIHSAGSWVFVLAEFFCKLYILCTILFSENLISPSSDMGITGIYLSDTGYQTPTGYILYPTVFQLLPDARVISGRRRVSKYLC